MRSTIDWNEIVPKLPKAMRDTLFLEAVTILSAAAPRSVPMSPATEMRAPRAPRIQGNSRKKGNRAWLVDGDGKTLGAPGRRYRINKTAATPPSRGKIGAVWAKLIESKNDSITYEGIASICKGQDVSAVSSMICQLWERRFIDIDTEKKVAVAY